MTVFAEPDSKIFTCQIIEHEDRVGIIAETLYVLTLICVPKYAYVGVVYVLTLTP